MPEHCYPLAFLNCFHIFSQYVILPPQSHNFHKSSQFPAVESGKSRGEDLTLLGLP
jgi:hypothetical protein